MDELPSNTLEPENPALPAKMPFSVRAAKLSFWSSFLATAGVVIVLLSLNNISAEGARWASRIIAGIWFLTVCVGFILGCIALCGIIRAGHKGILGRTLTGITVNAMLIGFGVTGLIVAADRHKEILGIKGPEELQALQTYNLTMAKLGRAEKAAQYMATHEKGEDALVGATLDKIVRSEQNLIQNYYATSMQLYNKRLLDVSTVKDKEELQKRVEMVQRYSTANLAMKSFTENLDQNFREDLAGNGLSPAAIDSRLEKFHQSMQAVNDSANGIWEINDEWAQGELKALKLLISKWGKWSYDKSTKHMVIQESEVADEMNALVDEINEAYHERLRLQQEYSKHAESGGK
jgi:hypothetical protein